VVNGPVESTVVDGKGIVVDTDDTAVEVDQGNSTALVVYDPEWAEFIRLRRARPRGRYVFEVAAEVHLQMGTRPVTKAQLIAARILAGRIMRDHGHRPTHVERDLPVVIMALVTPTVAEEDLDEWFTTALSDSPSRHRSWVSAMVTVMRA
jgi:hypothetical protein